MTRRTVNLPADIATKLDAIARHMNRPQTWVINLALEDYITRFSLAHPQAFQQSIKPSLTNSPPQPQEREPEIAKSRYYRSRR